MIAREYDFDKRRGRWTLYFFWAVIAGACATYAADFFDPRPQQPVRADGSPASAQAAVPASAPSVRALAERQSVTLDRVIPANDPPPDRTQQTASIAPSESPPTIAAPVLQFPQGPSLVTPAQASPPLALLPGFLPALPAATDPAPAAPTPNVPLTATPAEPAQLAALPPPPAAQRTEPEPARAQPPRNALRTRNDDVNGRAGPNLRQPVVRRLGGDLFLIPVETRGEWTRVQVWGEDGPDSNFWMFNNLLRPIDPVTGEIIDRPLPRPARPAAAQQAPASPAPSPAQPLVSPPTAN